jgi:hypothetical protein
MVSKLLVFWNYPKKHARKLKMREKRLATKMGEKNFSLRKKM